MKIVGAAHGYENSAGSYSDLHPSYEVEVMLSSLSKGSKFAIELIPKTDAYFDLIYQMQREGMSFRGEGYFQQVANLCELEDIEIIPIENTDLIIKQLNHFLDFSKTNDFSSFMNYLRLFNHEREKNQRKVISKVNPDVVFVGLAHANRWHFENVFDGSEYLFNLAPLYGDVAIHEPEPVFSKDLFQLSLSVDRLVNLYFNKQFGDRKPDFIGSWANNLLGYFEIYIDGNNNGIMSDFLGLADINGEITDTYVNFIKQYHQGANTSLLMPLSFTGEKVGEDKYAGTYGAGYNSGDFVIGKRLQPNLFSDENFNHVWNHINSSLSQWSYDYNRLEELLDESDVSDSGYTSEPLDYDLDDLPF